MPRKAAAAPAEPGEPRRSSRIKEQPKPQVTKKAPAKPRTKRGAAPKVALETEEQPAEGEPAAAKPKSARGKKRTPEEVNGPEDEAEKPPSKKVRRYPISTALSFGFLPGPRAHAELYRDRPNPQPKLNLLLKLEQPAHRNPPRAGDLPNLRPLLPRNLHRGLVQRSLRQR
jgi:hypothetical protein